MHKINPVIVKGTVQARCPKCLQPYTGELDCDQPEVILECVACAHRGVYFFHWPDELPLVTLRHKSNRRIVSRPRKGKSKKKKRTDPNRLPGQLAFSGFQEVRR